MVQPKVHNKYYYGYCGKIFW